MPNCFLRSTHKGYETVLLLQVRCSYWLLTCSSWQSQWYISEPMPRCNEHSPCHMATYQSILLQLIFSLIVAKSETSFDLNLRCQLPAFKYELLTSLVGTCRRLDLFHYPNMLARHEASAPAALVWLSVEETKRFGLALYKLCRVCAPSTEKRHSMVDRHERPSRNDLLTLQDLDFSMPDTDEVWNASVDKGTQLIRATALQQARGDTQNPDEWISNASLNFQHPSVGFDWI